MYRSDEVDTPYDVILRDGKRLVGSLKSNDIPLLPVSVDLFNGSGNRIRFTRDTQGKVTGALLHTSRIFNFRFERSLRLEKDPGGLGSHGRATGKSAVPPKSRRCQAGMSGPGSARGRSRSSHSITSSARSRSDVGTSMPSDLAVLPLNTVWILLTCSTGMSPGFAPLRILSTKTAARRNMSGKFTP